LFLESHFAIVGKRVRREEVVRRSKEHKNRSKIRVTLRPRRIPSCDSVILREARRGERKRLKIQRTAQIRRNWGLMIWWVCRQRKT